MLTRELSYELPDDLIARYPAPERESARLLVVERQGELHRRISQLPELIPSGALVVLNDTKVLRARLLGSRLPGGGRVELLLLRRVSGAGHRERWSAIGRANSRLRVGARLSFGPLQATIEAVAPGTLEVELWGEGDVGTLIAERGEVPLPPYLGRAAEPADAERYQTSFARHLGSVAAPTAGLHLTERLLTALAARGIEVAYVTLHVGLGTFRPVTAERLADHDMHAEQLVVAEPAVAAVARARARGAKVVAVGTTVVRALEAAADPLRPGLIQPFHGETRLLLYPGIELRVVDALLTNFHQPGSTLLALVACFLGLERLRAAYAVAIQERYRFLSYGDALWIPERLA